LAGVPIQDAGIGSGIINVSQQVAGVLSIALLSAVASGQTTSLVASGHSTIDALFGGYHLAFIVALASVLVGIVVAGTFLRRPSDQTATAVTGSPTFDAEAETMIVEIL